MQALAIIDSKAPAWKYVCKVWPQPRTQLQNLADLQMATHLGIEKNVAYATNTISRNFMPYLIGACDIYAAPSRLEGFGMPQNERLNFGFNEWLKAQDGQPMGQDWQTWSAALYLYAVKCVEEKGTPFFDEIRLKRL